MSTARCVALHAPQEWVNDTVAKPLKYSFARCKSTECVCVCDESLLALRAHTTTCNEGLVPSAIVVGGHTLHTEHSNQSQRITSADSPRRESSASFTRSCHSVATRARLFNRREDNVDAHAVAVNS